METIQVVTDPAKVQEIRNSIDEGRNILRAGKSNGKRITVEQALAIRMYIERASARIGEPSIFRPDFRIVDVTPAGFGPIPA